MKLPTNYDNLTPAQRAQVRLAYVAQQGGKCAHCKEPLAEEPSMEVRSYPMDEASFPPGFMNYRIHLHHDHTTGLTVGAVHARCNAYLKRYLNQ
jgi:hypothetical protein